MRGFARILAHKGYNSPDAIATAKRWANQYGSNAAPPVHDFKVDSRVQVKRTGERGIVKNVSPSGFITLHDGSSHHFTELR